MVDTAREPSPTLAVPATDAAGLCCPRCGYNLTGLPQDRCPECGLEGALRAAQGHRLRALRVRRFRTYRAVFLVAFIALWLASALLVGTLPARLGAVWLLRIAAAIAALGWCQCDAAFYGYHLGGGMALFVFVMPPLGVPIYLMSHRRWKSLLTSMGVIVGLAALAFGLSVLAFRIAHGYWAAL